MTQNIDTPNNFSIPPLPDQLKIRLHDTLSRYGEQDDESLLAEQVQILDRAFRCVVERAIHFRDVQGVAAALKAQNQCRQTMNALNKLEKLSAEQRKRR